MKAPCGQEDCDCGHTINWLVTAMETLLRAWVLDHPGGDAAIISDTKMRVKIARAAIKEAKP